MFSLIYAWINDWVNNREAGDLRRQHGHYDVIVMVPSSPVIIVYWSYADIVLLWDAITHPYPIFNDGLTKRWVGTWMGNYSPFFDVDAIIYPYNNRSAK